MDWIDELFSSEPKADHVQLDMIEDLLKTSVIPIEQNEAIYKSLDSLTQQEAEDMINFLNTKQINRIHAGLNYNMTYLNKFLKKSI